MKARSFFIASILFFGLGVLFLLRFQKLADTSDVAGLINDRLSDQLSDLNRDVLLYVGNDAPCSFTSESDFPFFVYREGEIQCWTDNSLLPPLNLITDQPSIQLVKMARGNFLLYQQPISNGRQIASLLLLTRDYPIQNDFFSNTWNEELFPTGRISILEPSSNLGIPIGFENEVLFRISFIQEDLLAHPLAGYWAIVFISLSTLLFLLGFIKWTNSRYGPGLSFGLVAIAVLTIRIVALGFNFPRSILVTQLFSPQQFASSTLNPSLGDLILNVIVILFLAIVLFRYWKKADIQYEPLNAYRLVLLTIVSFILFGSAHFPVQTLQTIVHNSNIDFSITSSLDVSFIRVASFLAILIAWVAAFLVIHVLTDLVLKLGGKHAHRILLAGMFLFSFVNYWENQPFLATVCISWVTILIIHYAKFNQSLERIQYRTFAYVFVILLGMVLNVSIRIYYLDKEEGLSNQVKFADGYLVDKDSFGEFLLNDLSQKIKEDAFIQTRLISPFLSKLPIQQKIRQVYFSSYFNKYDIHIRLFNSLGNSLTEYSTATFPEIVTALEKTAERTDYEGVFRIKNISGEIAQQYVLIVQVNRGPLVGGYVVIELSLKKDLPQSSYPELLVDNRFRESLKPNDLSYASFVNGVSLSSSGDFNYDKFFNRAMLKDSRLYSKGIEKDGYQHYAVKTDDGVTIVVSSVIMTPKQFFANVSFYLILGLFLILVFILWLGILNIIKRRQVYYAARIQLFITLSFFIPLLSVSIVTLRMLTDSSQEQLNRTFLSRAVFMADQLNSYTTIADSSGVVNDLEIYLLELSKLSNTELILYDSSGTLELSSQSSLFDNQLISVKTHPEAMRKISNGEMSFVLEDKIGGLVYYIAFARLSADGAILAIPYYQSASSISMVQIEALTSILVIFGIVFLVLLMFSFLISKWLTAPIEFITATLQRTSLESSNEAINWKSNDEIGLMVNSYNTMLVKLEDSKVQLERMQREQAWREIAQQVAHEIKNPLTPMKLTLQRMMRNMEEGKLSSDKTSQAVSSLLEQVELLNTIASSFSSFAKMPMAVVGTVDVKKLLLQSVELYKDEIEVKLEVTEQHMLAKADASILLSVFSNLILNAVQASVNSRDSLLIIKVHQLDSSWEIEFEDNGTGIESDKLEKIFLPHFTTKASGSGLGLAIAKQAIEQMGGSIVVKSKLGQGSTFIILLPRA